MAFQTQSRRCPRRALRAVVVLLAAAFISGCARTPAGPAAGETIGGSVTPGDSDSMSRTLRVATFNIHGGKGRDGRRDLKRIARLCEGYDLVGLNEVRGGEPDQAELLGRQTGMAWLFAPVERRGGRDDFGNGLLTARALRHWQRLPISAQGADTNRNVLFVRLPYDGGILNVLITHLGRRQADRPGQLRAVAELFLALEPPAILMGDLNTPRGDDQLERLLGEEGVTDVLSQGRETPPSTIDWILVRGIRVVRSGLKNEVASDHPIVWAEVQLNQ